MPITDSYACAFQLCRLDVARQDIVSTVSRLLSVSHAGDEEIRVSASGFSLATTITKPVGPAPAAGGRWPAVLLVPGSGSVDRDEHVFGIPIFGEIAGALADAGLPGCSLRQAGHRSEWWANGERHARRLRRGCSDDGEIPREA